MRKRCLLLLAALLAAGPARAQGPTAVDFANLQEDVRGLNQRLGDLTLRVEQLERQAAAAQNSPSLSQTYATIVQLNTAVADLNRSIQAAVASSQQDTLARVNEQIQKLAKLSAARAASGKPAGAAVSFGSDYPKTGVSYTVVKGDTVDLIAKKTGAKARDIIDANKLADPSRIVIGQSLFIPGGK